MESDQYVVLYWNTESDHEGGWAWTLHDRSGTEIERGKIGQLRRDDPVGAQTAVAQQWGCQLAWQAGQQPDVLAFVGRLEGSPGPTPPAKHRLGEHLADAPIAAAGAAARADDIRVLVQGEGPAEGVAIENLAGLAMRLSRRGAKRWRTRRDPEIAQDPPSSGTERPGPASRE